MAGGRVEGRDLMKREKIGERKRFGPRGSVNS